MKCPVCGNRMTEIRKTVFRYLQLKEYHCELCDSVQSEVQYVPGKKAEIYIKLLKSFISMGIFEKIVSERDYKRFREILREIEKKIDKSGFNISEYDEVEHLGELRELLIEKLERNLQADKPVKGILEEIKILDNNIQSAITRKKQKESEQKVFIFEFDGVEHEV